ncbi:hypothetical protein IHQ71_01505 [Rhizobium sp. TH2]|uniref:hypothetical protein n=1 Tax=Rhizobium sp. TH2 TaxID=2775403 RepID=UPI002157D778|nr:hypothetical protein [Rhizobium sp. TH2]UVC09334.1 hypothetical protein IHQ71_01505 [Rhizobium sp. TH2]
MNKIVREHYPVSKLPEELKKEFEGVATVRLVLEETPAISGAAALEALEAKYQAHAANLASEGPIDFSRHRGKTTIAEAVARVRELRDEWDDE